MATISKRKKGTTEFIYLVLIAIIAVKRITEITKLKYEKRNREGDIQIYNTVQITKSSLALSLSL